jgi:hypothetical protein
MTVAVRPYMYGSRHLRVAWHNCVTGHIPRSQKEYASEVVSERLSIRGQV